MEIFDYAARITTHSNNLGEGEFSGLASVFGSLVQSWVPTVIERGAFAKTLRENGSRVKILFNHDQARPIGKAIMLQEVPAGLYLKGKISATTEGRDVLTLLRDGTLDSLSIGFDPGPYEMRKDETGREVRHLTDIERLWEVSIVPFPADPKAIISEVHGVQLFSAGATREAELAKLQAMTEEWKAGKIPDFREVYGAGWRF